MMVIVVFHIVVVRIGVYFFQYGEGGFMQANCLVGCLTGN